MPIFVVIEVTTPAAPTSLCWYSCFALDELTYQRVRATASCQFASKWFRDRLNLSTSRGMWWSLGVPARICTKIGTVVTYPHPELVCKYFNMYTKISRFILILLYLDSKSKVQDSKSNLLDSKTKLQEREIKLLKSEVKLNR